MYACSTWKLNTTAKLKSIITIIISDDTWWQVQWSGFKSGLKYLHLRISYYTEFQCHMQKSNAN